MKTRSYGIVILNERGDVLLCHATETAHWDIPKGQGEHGETPVEAALRETAEETGLTFMPGRLLDLGVFPYRRDKDLHLFAIEVDTAAVDIDTCVCRSLFPRPRDGVMIPEMDGYRWVPPEAVAEFASGSLARLFTQLLPLAELRRRLCEVRAAGQRMPA